LLITRLFIGIGEAAYGPAAPTIIADLYPVRWRGSVMAWFYMAIPVGSALGYVLAPVPLLAPPLFLLLHIFVGFVQAFVFTLLPIIYLGGAVGEEH